MSCKYIPQADGSLTPELVPEQLQRWAGVSVGLRGTTVLEPSAGVSSRKEIEVRAEKRCSSSAMGRQFTAPPRVVGSL